MKKRIYSLLLAASTLFAVSCDLDLLENPNAVNADTASPDFLLNRIQLDYQGLFNTIGDDGMRLTRIINQGSAQYEGAYTPVTTNGYWSNAYANILADIQFLEPLAEEAQFLRHLGIAKTIKAMVLFHLVDSYGDVPYSEALNPDEFNPGVDSGESVYFAALDALNEAQAHFQASTSSGSPNDYYYGRNYTKWIRLINTLKLRYHLNRKLVDPSGATAAINALVAEDNFLKEGDDFVFQFGTTAADPDSRHPRFAGQYTSGGGDYQSTYYMWHLTEAKGFDDPRARFYFYRQVLVNSTNPDEIECITQLPPPQYLVGGFIYCLPGERGYWGRDHLDPDGIPPDGLKRTAWGVYPAGGRFDDDSASPVNNPSLGAQGAGVHPIMLAAYVDFMLAEAALTLGTSGDAKDYMLSGIEKHMNYVYDWSMGTSQAGAISSFLGDEGIDYDQQVANYLTYVGDEYDDAASADDRMDIIGREYWLSLFGSGIEAFNLYRRTGKPDNMQPGLEPNPGTFPRSFFYPNNYMVTNNKAVQKADQSVQVFWDTNPPGNAWVY
ncbi:MAG: SusD/RagB family nutrient-binding outer membrane lipoprotein [Cyclobacteriaceae bacterium]|uniref:SusD/RagB family nutrient-binding outer membrane lipoprotein n=1 Tax=Algoriphagus sp. TaxID=1872435 RepID=UPI00180F5DF4|nr:SusD/RagB family nutrient-binding outer membrane lipoprotein [Algoriphagus sp.]NVJ86891.1 SusD/RagB family nutrient-binding outer membrane lipoprotein [Algoriphagus sp.]NVK48358.1 SusD/RagB family nutrient-binding outer membrane lipoprotein [Cyclobacteriaceae bacterium]